MPTAAPKYRRPGFTLIELMVVMAIIVLLLGLSLPAFNLIRGSRSVESAQNQLSALLARARNEAIGKQKPAGVMFFLDPATQRASAALVEQVSNITVGTAPNTSSLIVLDLVPGVDILSLPDGVLVQTVDDAAMDNQNPPNRLDDGYIGFNTGGRGSLVGGGLAGSVLAPRNAYGGAILFDGSGQIISHKFAYRMRMADPAMPNGSPVESPLGQLLYDTGGVPSNLYAVMPADGNDPPLFVKSSIGLAVFDGPTFLTKFGTNALPDAQIDGRPYGTEVDEETWIDKNALILLVNRYNGTLVKGE